MVHIDPLRDFDQPNFAEVRRINYGESFVVAGIASIRGQTYAIPLIWNAEDDAYEVLHVSAMFQHQAAGLNLWSKIGVELSKPSREEMLHLLIPGVANLPHRPRRRT